MHICSEGFQNFVGPSLGVRASARRIVYGFPKIRRTRGPHNTEYWCIGVYMGPLFWGPLVFTVATVVFMTVKIALNLLLWLFRAHISVVSKAGFYPGQQNRWSV